MSVANCVMSTRLGTDFAYYTKHSIKWLQLLCNFFNLLRLFFITPTVYKTKQDFTVKKPSY